MRVSRCLGIVALLTTATTGISAQWPERRERMEIIDRIWALKTELRSLEAKLLPPAPSDISAYSDLLRQPGTGVIRLMPRQKFASASIVTMNGGGAYYSFKRLTHEYGYGSDISLEQDEFSVGFAGADHGFIGIVEGNIKSVTLEDPGVQFLATLKAPTREQEARAEAQQGWQGIVANGIRYKGRQEAAVGRTYVLRSISYDKSDLLVCFEAVRRDFDGSWILVWKILKEFEPPKLIRAPQAN